ncbi:MAG: hypothetical protein GY812_02460 [Actinomycetia bacterium]|nr:hypothetical protein [Actinomycetes bacterium]
MSFRDRFYTPKVARAITSPSAILATGGGAAVGILVGLGPIGAVVLGAAAYGARVLAAVPRDDKRDAVAPRSLDQPWRGAVEQVQDARRRFDDAIDTLSEGPLRERLDGVADRLDVALAEAWRIAKAGNVLSKGRKRIDTTRITAELDHARAQPGSARRGDTIAAMESQLASAARIDTTIADTYDRLLLLDARTDEAVARAVEISVSQSDPDAVQSLEGDVTQIVGDLESLRLAIEET